MSGDQRVFTAYKILELLDDAFDIPGGGGGGIQLWVHVYTHGLKLLCIHNAIYCITYTPTSYTLIGGIVE